MKKVTFISIFMLLGIMVNTICAQSLKKLYFTTEQNSEKKRSVNETAYLQSKLNLSEKFTFQNKRNSTKEILAEITDSLGYTHRRYEQYYNGIKIEHSDIRVHIFNGNLVSANGEYASFEHLDTSVIITTAEALNLAKDFVRSLINDTSNNYSLNSYYNPEVVICNNRTDINDTLFHVAYKVDVYSDEHFIHEYIYVDSKNGEILNHISLIRRSNGIAATRYSGNQVISTNQVGGYYVLIDTTRGNGIKTYNLNNSTNVANAVYFTDNDNNWTANEFNNAQKDNGALDAHWGAMMTYDYFKEVHGRNSYDDNNAELINYVHYDSNYENAEWDPSVKAMFYGDGDLYCDILTSLDIVSHEIGHAISEYSANLVYQDESGAIDESLSDIWAASVEEWATSDKDTWLIGEDIGCTERSMSNPNSFDLPDTYKGNYWEFSTNDYGGVHTNSSVMNHWFYLLTEGGSGITDFGKSYSVSGIGILKAAKIVYRAETTYMTGSSQFIDVRRYTTLAAKDLYGGNSDEVNSVENAWNAVGVDIDLYIRDSIDDNGNEPSNVKYMYNSPDIWIGDSDGNPVDNIYGSGSYYVCVRIHNKRAVSSTGTEKLYLNWAKAGVNLPWPSGWDGEEDKDIGCDEPKKMSGNVGDSLCYSIPIILPYNSVVVKIPWMVPDGNEYDCGIFAGSAEQWHFCLLARVHDSETIRYEDSDSCRIDTFVVRNNNVAWKNISVIEGSNNKAVVWLQNHLNTTQKFQLNFTAHPNSKNELLNQYAETYIRLSPNVYEAWNAGGRKGTGISEAGENRLRITENNATLKDISLPANAVGMLETEVNFLSEVIPQDKTFTFDIAMYDSKGKTLYGGEHYMAIRDDERTFDVVAMQNQTAMAETSITFSAVNIGEPATYLWYNAAGDSIASGTTLSTTATQSQQYRLSVQATADGYKGYDTVSLVVRNGAITSLSPNPATNQVVVSYSVTNQVQGGTVQIANTNGIVLLSTPFAAPQTSTILNLHNLTAGQYSVRLVSATGEVLDSKTLIVQ